MKYSTMAVCVLTALIVSLSAYAEESVGDDELAQQATELLAQGQEQEAAQIVSSLLIHPNPPMQALFLAGQMSGNAGNWGMAIYYYHLMQQREPSQLRVRLELARALYMNGNFGASRRCFQMVLDEPSLPDEVRPSVMEFISQIDRLAFNQLLSIELIYDNNVNQATNNPQLTLGGLPFMLTKDSLQTGGSGVGVLWQGQYRFGEADQYSLRSLLQHQNFQASKFDFGYAQTYAGQQWEWGAQHFTLLEGGGHLAILGNRKLYDGATFRVSDSWRGVEQGMSTFYFDGRQMNFPDYPFRNGWQYWLGIDLTQTLLSGATLSAGGRYGRNLAQDASQGFIAHGIKLGWSAELPFRTMLNMTADYQYNQYSIPEPLFGITKTEKIASGEVEILPLALSIDEVQPRFVIGSVANNSNLSLYDYHRVYFKLVLTQQF